MRGGGGVTRSLEAFFKKSIWWRSAAAVSAGAAASDLTGVGGHFPQLDTPVEPDDGAEGAPWQHALSSSQKLLAGY